MGNLAVLLVLAPQAPKPDPGWEALSRDVLQQQGHVVVDFIMEPLARQRPDTALLGDGLTAFALLEPTLIKPPTAISTRALEETQAYEATVKHEIFDHGQPEAVYLEVLFQAGTPGKPANQIPRGGLAYLLSGLGEYRTAGIFTIHPYQLSTNTERQFTGVRWESHVVKLVRKH
jgi:hypothetical protein